MAEALTIVANPGSPPVPQPPEAASGMLLHKFVKADTWRGGLTPDATGGNLPRTGSPWIYEKEVVVSPSDRRAGATPAQITSAIADRGFFLFPIADDV
jgi:hypothetical protein